MISTGEINSTSHWVKRCASGPALQAGRVTAMLFTGTITEILMPYPAYALPKLLQRGPIIIYLEKIRSRYFYRSIIIDTQ